MERTRERYTFPTVTTKEELLIVKFQRGAHIPEVRQFALYLAAIAEKKIDADWGYLDPYSLMRLRNDLADRLNVWDDGFGALRYLSNYPPADLIHSFADFLKSLGYPTQIRRFTPEQARLGGYHDGQNERAAVVLDYDYPIRDIKINIKPEVSDYTHALKMQMIYGGMPYQKPDLGSFGI